MKKISIVIPTYRRPKLLSECLKALLNQEFDRNDYEIIVVSDGPDPATDDMVRSFPSSLRLRYYALAENSGPAAARNKGWQLAYGELVAFTDDDCLPDIKWLKNIWTAYNGEKLIAFSGRVIVPVSKKPTDYELNTSDLEKADFITANCCLTKAALQVTAGFDERFRAAWREDSDLEFKLLSAYIPVKKLKSAVVVHPVRQTKWGVSIYEQKKGMFNALLYKKYPSLYRKKIQKAPAWDYYIMIGCFAGMLLALFFNSWLIAALSCFTWLVLTCRFIKRRLSKTSREPKHVMEMVLTSFIIPFTSVFWQLYGAVKYRVLFM